MSECTNVRKLLAVQRADWSAEETRQVESHLSRCEECSAAADAYAEQDRWSQAMPAVTLTPEQREKVLTHATATARDRRAPARPGRLSVALGSAVAVAVIALIAFGMAALFRQQAEQQGITGIREGTLPASTEAVSDSSPLAGTEWVLDTINGKAPLEGTHVTLSFEKDQLGGFAGCNAYGGGPDNGGYSASDDGKLTIPQFAITLMDCSGPEGVMDQEVAYIEALRCAVTYQIVDDRLELADDSGQTILVYARQPEFDGNPADLLGTDWRLVSLDGQSLIEGSEITLAFQDAATASGHAGRRDYVCAYQATGGDLTFLSTTMVGDISPDDPLLEQEGQYTTILGWTRHYRLTGGQLELFSARGETLVFVAMPSGSQGDMPTPAPTVASPLAGSNLGKLAWIQDGDVWIRVLPDGGPVRLTDDGRNSEPRWSASGEWLAFRKDSQVWLVRASGQDSYAVDSGGVIDTFAWAPVGDDRLAYVAGSGMLRLEVLRAGETAPLSLLPPSAEGQPGRIAWRPDGTSIAYEWRQGRDYEGLWQVPAGGGDPVELYDSGLPERGEALLAGWRADGEYLLFWQGDINSASILADGVPFYALPATGGQPVLLAGGNDGVLYSNDAWSTSRDWGYVALTVGSGRETWTNKHVAAANPDIVEDLVIVTDDTVAASSPVFIPGGAQLAYVAAPDAAGVSGGDAAREVLFQRHIWVIGEDSATPRQLTDDPAYRDERPLWSVDGSHLLFVRMDQRERVSLWLLPGQEDAVQQVADGLGPLPGEGADWFGNYGHVEWGALYDWWQAPIEIPPPPDVTPIPTTAPIVAVDPGVAELLGNPSAPGESVELDAYFSGAGSTILPSGPPPPPDQVSCPTNLGWAAALTDQPFLASLQLLNGTFNNALPEGGTWLVATTPEATQPGRKILPQLPYLGRFRGHLGDPAFADCPNADRIFVVDEVMAVYREQAPAADAWALPPGYADWPHFPDTVSHVVAAGETLTDIAAQYGVTPEALMDANGLSFASLVSIGQILTIPTLESSGLGFSLPYPPGWDVAQIDEPDAVSAVALRDPELPASGLVVRVHAGETVYDQYDPASLPILLQGSSFGVYEQGLAFGQPVEGSQGLPGYTVERGPGEEAVLFSGGGYTYELDMTYPTGGFDASQALLTAYTAMVEGFRLGTVPGPTPTPPIKDTLGPGPFLSEEEALARVRARDGQNVELWDAALLSEASARQMADACSTFTGHPDGVWLLTVRGTYEGTIRTLDLFLDATTGEQLCGEEIAVSGEGEGSPRLRVTNDSPYALDRVVVIFPGERIAFGPLAAGETSDYRAVRGGVYGYAAYNVALNGQIIDQPVVDWIGEQPLEGESFTYVLSVDPERPFMQQIQSEVHEDRPGEA